MMKVTLFTLLLALVCLSYEQTTSGDDYGDNYGDYDTTTTTGPTSGSGSGAGPTLTAYEDYLPFINLEEIQPNDLDNTPFQEVRRTLDGCSDPIYNTNGVPYGSITETKLFVCANGVISFGRAFTYYYPDNFPTSYANGFNVVALFWNDHDHRGQQSSIRYRIYNETGDNALISVNEYLFNQLDGVIFEGTWMLVAEWRDVPQYPFDYPGNTYQALIITDGLVTYTVFTYDCSSLHWTGRYRHAVVGYNIDSKSALGINFNSYTNHPLSRQSSIKKIACDNIVSGVNEANLKYQIGSATGRNEKGRQMCLEKNRLEPLTQSYGQPCPCSFWQAIFDSRYSYASSRLARTTGDSSFYNTLCFVQRFRPRFGDGVQMCCYNRDFSSGFGALLDSSAGYYASSLLRHHPFWDSDNYVEVDYAYRESCCFDSNSCDLYTDKRPADSCATYTAPRRAWCWGDPHITNLDGGVYTFNGWGEYTLYDIDIPDAKWLLQGRTNPVEGSTATQLVGLAFGIDKENAVQVLLPEDDTSDEPLLVYFRGESILANISSTNDTFEHENATITRGSATSLVCSFPSGIGMIVNASSMLGFTLIIPDEYKAMSRGLSGNFNGDPTDDVAFRNGTMLPVPVADRVLHQVASSWAIDAQDSLFTYTDGRNASYYQHPEHMPVFADEVVGNASQEIMDACGDSKDCIFDAMQTGDISMGLASKESNGMNIEEKDQLENFPPSIEGPRTIQLNISQTTTILLSVTDDQDLAGVSVTTSQDIPGLVLTNEETVSNALNLTYEWTVDEFTSDLVDTLLSFTVEDGLGARSMLTVQVQICACEYEGECTMEGIVGISANTILLNCLCTEGREGLLCEVDIDGCAQMLCLDGQTCVDNPAPDLGGDCGDCPVGYVENGGRCADVDECMDLSFCDQNCVNTEGSFECTCENGFRLSSDTACEDIDECEVLNGGCHQTCNNTDGSFSCGCDEGFELSADDSTCTIQAGSMCSVPNSCSHTCVSLSGEDICGCNPGFSLAQDGQTCNDINECEVVPCGSNGICTNTEGTFMCACVTGYALGQDARTCEDLDECLGSFLAGVDLCNTTDTSKFCSNIPGDYDCLCPDGTDERGENCIILLLLPEIPSGLRQYAVIIMLQSHSLKTFTEAVENTFQAEAFNAINSYCQATASCNFNEDIGPGTLTDINDVKITNIDITPDGYISFYLYAGNMDGTLDSVSLLNALQGNNGALSRAGFSATFDYLEAPPTRVELGTGAIVGIAVAVVAVVTLIITAVIVGVVVYKSISKANKTDKALLIETQEIKKSPHRSSQVVPIEISTSM